MMQAVSEGEGRRVAQAQGEDEGEEMEEREDRSGSKVALCRNEGLASGSGGGTEESNRTG